MKNSIVGIGALGGSGTRVVAQIIHDLGIYIGDNLNHANDNLIFTILFKNPSWYKNSSPEEFATRFTLFRKYMEEDFLSEDECDLLDNIAKQNSFIKFYSDDFSKKLSDKLNNLKLARKTWAWKEPNTQVFTNQLIQFDDSIKYIHVLRHGLDMAFSKNKQQLKNWGYRFGIDYNENDNEDKIAYKQLSYWIESTKEINKFKEEYNDRISILNHERLCSFPPMEINKLVSFLNINPDKKIVEHTYTLPETPISSQRFKKYDIGIFDKDQLDYVKDLGFQI